MMFDLPARFWSKVRRGAADNCWPFSGAHNGYGHGHLWWRGRKVYAHRLMLMSLGHDVRGLHVLHKCDNPRCVNPRHLYAGTQRENMRDFAARGHGNRHDSNGMSKLSRHQVAKIRAAYAVAPRSSGGARAKKGTLQALAGQFHVSPSAINLIVHNHRWRQA